MRIYSEVRETIESWRRVPEDPISDATSFDAWVRLGDFYSDPSLDESQIRSRELSALADFLARVDGTLASASLKTLVEVERKRGSHLHEEWVRDRLLERAEVACRENSTNGGKDAKELADAYLVRLSSYVDSPPELVLGQNRRHFAFGVEEARDSGFAVRGAATKESIGRSYFVFERDMNRFAPTEWECLALYVAGVCLCVSKTAFWP